VQMLISGDNTLEINVTGANGQKETYTLHVHVDSTVTGRCGRKLRRADFGNLGF